MEIFESNMVDNNEIDVNYLQNGENVGEDSAKIIQASDTSNIDALSEEVVTEHNDQELEDQKRKQVSFIHHIRK